MYGYRRALDFFPALRPSSIFTYFGMSAENATGTLKEHFFYNSLAELYLEPPTRSNELSHFTPKTHGIGHLWRARIFNVYCITPS